MTASPASFDVEQLYRDLHAHPELSFQEVRTAGIVAETLRALGYETHDGVGRTGVVGVIRNGEGPTVMLRADMDALPVEEKTGLSYASTARGVDPSGEDVAVMHACGHDVHVSCLLGAARELSQSVEDWSGTLLLVFQPAEELGAGARSMIEAGLFDIAGKPDIVLGQHVMPLPSGYIGFQSGPAFAAADSLRIRLHGRGGHGSRAEAAIDPVVMAAATVMRLQTIVSREVGGSELAVITVGSISSGNKANIIPETAELLLSVRTYDPNVRERVLAAITRIVDAEAAASGAPRSPEIEMVVSFPALANDPAAVARTVAGFAREFGADRVLDPGPVMASEDVAAFALAAGVPSAYWLLGGGEPAAYESAEGIEQMRVVQRTLPANHSPFFAPVPQPTLDTGVRALVRAARTWLSSATD